ncbi:MAG: biotin/lipoyl-containing protein [Bacteroidota bacterium]
MKEIIINKNKKFTVNRQNDQLLVNGAFSNYVVEKLSESSFKVYSDFAIHTVEVIYQQRKKMILSVNNRPINVEIMDQMDQVLAELGMDSTKISAISEVKAPMPGSILDIMVEEGKEVRSGDQLVILEAMKMENVIKSPGDGLIDKIHVSLKQSVEKNQVLISFK